ncbi:phosphoribosylaminoimidazole-succinocarboxamide synthase [Neolewinella xylanilytica]|uniref:Phosphoribosylaminoimidazole-succinocarboxamide synthase n=1 Tax=Neolewinella xylanilytica TaxID=1514080 RepID=A0A2S6I9Y8_9BACT|nr:phosphoribosylaminoimidazolesuccinocarboxamide synthase [Neolewinella xylanilytica]PPK88310.1 phosphoribosylaminoimidazole-succinocarboxamide synthase [Neolewinella xylanilytica]
MANALRETNFSFDPPATLYRGKVRDVYRRDGQLLMVASDRISAFDHVLPRAIPHKGQILNQIAAHFLEATRDICPNWLESNPDPNVAIGKACQPVPIEMVIRGYLVGHGWREYQAGKRELCGVPMPEGMKEADAFPEPIITPATKAEEGHDEDISREAILERGIVAPDVYRKLENYTRRLFARGTAMAAERGLILVDTKYEFGIADGEIYLIDEIHTPDSSRYFYAEGYADRQARGEHQKQLSKEFVREWLMEHDFRGLAGQTMPEMPDEFVERITARYTELFELITGKTFQPAATEDIAARIASNLSATDWKPIAKAW